MSLLSSVQESQPGHPYYYNIDFSGGGGGGGGGVESITIDSGSNIVGNVNFASGDGITLANIGNNVTATNTGVQKINVTGSLSNLTGGTAGVTLTAGSNITLTATGGATPTVTIAASGGGGGGAGSFTSLVVSGTTTLGLTTIPSAVLYSVRQTLSATASNVITYSGINVFNGTYTCVIRGDDELSFYSAITSFWGVAATGPGNEILKIADSSNVQAGGGTPLSFTPTANIDGDYVWRPVFTSPVVNSGSNFTCTLSPNFG